MTSLGEAVRTSRRQMGLTQRELADLSSLSIRAIRDIEADRVRIPRPDTIRLLSEALRADEAALGRLIAADGMAPGNGDGRAAHDGPAAIGGHAGTRSGLGLGPPPAAPDGIIGRAEETRLLTSRLVEDGQRLITISGISGVGKTRLAIETARTIGTGGQVRVAWLPAAVPDAPASRRGSQRYRAESWPGTQPETGHAAAGQPSAALAGGDPAGLIGCIGDEPTLLVVDGMPGDRDGVVWAVAELLRRCPCLSVLYAATSPLDLPGEWVLPLAPLELPPPAAGANPADLLEVPSVRLLLTHLLQVWPTFRLNQANGPVIAEICRLVDGLPYALAHAASACLVDSPAAVLDQASRDPLSLSSPLPGGSRGLRQMLRGDVNALDPELRGLLRGLARLDGDWTVEEAAARIGTGVDDVVQLVYILVKRGMVRTAERHRQPRFRLLNLLRVVLL